MYFFISCVRFYILCVYCCFLFRAWEMLQIRIGKKSMKKFHLKHTHNANAVKANEQNAANDAKEDARFVCNTNRFCLFSIYSLSLSFSLCSFFSVSHRHSVLRYLRKKNCNLNWCTTFGECLQMWFYIYVCETLLFQLVCFLLIFFRSFYKWKRQRTNDDEKTERKKNKKKFCWLFRSL